VKEWPAYKLARDLASGKVFPVGEAVILQTARKHGIGRKMGRATRRQKIPEPVDIHAPQFSQADLCTAAGITMSTANNWIQSGVLRPSDIAIRSIRKPRVFSLLAIYEAKTTAEVVEWLGMSPPKAAAIARRTTAEGLNWHLSSVQRLSKGRTPSDVSATVFWSDQCQDRDVRVELPSGGILRINVKAMVELRGEPAIADRPFLVLPIARYFTAVYKKCKAVIASSPKDF
jgi:hypothetical protein